MKKDEKLIKKIAEELLKKMTFKDASVEVQKQKNSDALVVKIQAEDAGQLIGQSGNNLNDLQKILRMLIINKNPDAPLVLLDINDYREKREDFLRELGRELADQVIETKKSVMLQPMSSYERRIIHVELADKSDVSTESIGERNERRVVIKPK